MSDAKSAKKSPVVAFLNWVERVGNKLPHPFMMFLYLAVGVIILSAILAALGVAVKHPSTDKVVAIKSLVSKDGILYMFKDIIKNFTGFAPLGLVLTMMLGIGLAEQVGLMNAVMKRFIMGAPKQLLVWMIFFIGVCGNIASDASVIIIPPLAGAIFYAAKRNPLVGIAIGYSAALAGFTANILIVGTDALLAGISQEAARIIDPAATVSPAVNYFFMIVSTFIMTAIGVWTTTFVEKKAGPFKPKAGFAIQELSMEVSDAEKKGLRAAGIATLVYFAIVIAALWSKTSIFRNADGGLVPSPFLSSIITFIFLWFIIVGLAYGRTVGAIKNGGDVAKHMTAAMKDMAGYIVLVFVIAQFISYFNWTNMGLVLAVTLGNILKAWNFTGIPLVIAVILFTTFVNLFIGSGSAKWALLAPVFVPMFMMLDYSPAFAQTVYRIGDSMTNNITPLMPYFPVLLGFIRRYDEDAGIGTVMSMTLPFSITFGIGWIIQIIVWMLLDLPLGPGATIFM
ncbi:MAG: AbgT family transporter [Spirochaetales bacterium]|nr:AbgT family transporter [Spirochaetales bacterium]